MSMNVLTTPSPSMWLALLLANMRSKQPSTFAMMKMLDHQDACNTYWDQQEALPGLGLSFFNKTCIYLFACYSFNFPTNNNIVDATSKSCIYLFTSICPLSMLMLENISATHLSSQLYSICIRREAGYCAICYFPHRVLTTQDPGDQVEDDESKIVCVDVIVFYSRLKFRWTLTARVYQASALLRTVLMFRLL